MDVLFCNAVAAARTAKLLDSEKCARMSEASSLAEALKVASESGFGGDSTSLDDAIQLEETLATAFVREYAPNDSIKAVLLADYDFHNAEALIKAKYLGLEVTNLLRPDGVLMSEDMSVRIAKDECNVFPPELREALSFAREAFEAGTDGMAVGSIFARAKTKYLLRLSTNGTLKKMLIYHIDTTNIQTCARARSYALAEKMILEGGSLKESTLRKICESSPETLAVEFRLTTYSDYIADVVEALSAKRPFVAAERRVASHDIAFLRERRFELGGYLPWVLYVLYKQSEIANVRIIAAGLAGKLAGSKIRERLRDGYEG